MFKLGLTGGIATGKTTISNYLKTKGIPVLDADEYARKVVEPGTPGLTDIVNTFGKQVLQSDGSLNRKLLGQIIFNDMTARQTLNDITHPRIQQMMTDELQKLAKDKTPLVILDIPLLLENHNIAGADAIMVVTVPESIQLNRLMQRNNLTKEDAQGRIDAQMPLSEKEKLADFIVDNSGTIANTLTQVDKVIQKITESV
ncbi:dephospho-CoA kinase [Weissella paramesenteroides]|jgi:dephospho-CoA kinase|uniref:dephospho-CoA kinase n=1 Tax=Weissella paramesenteroides TaxID=1249 RepID=UPI0012392C9F|nr:dephospho-CoA kinase [Weissella paramesenteroides]KAA8440406.1 dephospho-CoA kinase [Weissella paramesenteroides]KAA8441003.1 dephospho-CoA kinase [Weissella paramesenteroides]KAA8443434.1 dephospho-CoA kinase [Weissella paramesenteroides]KAA8447723.1 dephospho-CoA kinase [Weissella paramesenteroides]KAA8449674.1 dephospho-CoA kinase [Weissella paramesenteroides]